MQFLGGLALTILLDIIHISIYYPRVGLMDTGRFGAGMAILSLLLKPFSCFLIYHMYLQRGGGIYIYPGEPLAAEHTARSPRLSRLPLASPSPKVCQLPVSGEGARSQPPWTSRGTCPIPRLGVARVARCTQPSLPG